MEWPIELIGRKRGVGKSYIITKALTRMHLSIDSCSVSIFSMHVNVWVLSSVDVLRVDCTHRLRPDDGYK